MQTRAYLLLLFPIGHRNCTTTMSAKRKRLGKDRTEVCWTSFGLGQTSHLSEKSISEKELQENWHVFIPPHSLVETFKKMSLQKHHSLREIKNSAKTVKTFETQKLVKRIKRLRYVWSYFVRL